jgi:hypothetical protein
MKMVKSLLLGAAAGVVAVAGAQAADLPVKAKPVQYVKICSLYGAGFYYIPGTDTCLKVGGYLRAEVNYNAGGSFAVPATLNLNNRNANVENWRVRSAITLDARSQTEYGTLRSYLFISATSTNSQNAGAGVGNTTGATGYTALYAPAAFIQFAGFTAGKTASFFDFDTQPYSNQSNFWGSNQGGNGIEVFAYTAQFGNGLSASISAENPQGRRMGIWNGVTAYGGYAGQEWPDVVGNLRIDQAWGSAQIMGALHQVRAQDATFGGVYGHPSDEVGWAVGAGLKLNAPMLGKSDYVIGQFTYSEGAMDYVASGAPLLQTVTTDNPITVANTSLGYVYDGVWNGGAGGSMDLTKGWSFTGGYEHFWNSQWKTSIYGAYGKIEYTDASSATLLGAAGSSANWDLWQVGSRTVWTPVTNLDLSLEVMYNKMDTGFGNAGYGDNDWVSGIFRVQRNFYP